MYHVILYYFEYFNSFLAKNNYVTSEILSPPTLVLRLLICGCGSVILRDVYTITWLLKGARLQTSCLILPKAKR